MCTSLHVYFSFVTIIQGPVDGYEAHSPIGDVRLNVSSSNVSDDVADASKVCYMCLHFFMQLCLLFLVVLKDTLCTSCGFFWLLVLLILFTV
jgi:hypothetical protein